LARWPDGGIKMYLIYKLSHFRRPHPDLFVDGDYVPLCGTGDLNGNICVFARRTGLAWALAVVPRLIGSRVVNGATLLSRDFWQSTTVSLPAHAPRRWSNVLTGEMLETIAVGHLQQLPVAKVFQSLPVALLYSCTGPDHNE
jgi:(1->4)-alpha-D-glucan 1-alpha-D-glucosylmutase